MFPRSFPDGQHGDIAVFYTVWSYAKGARRKIVLETAEYLKKERGIKRFVTLSPLQIWLKDSSA